MPNDNRSALARGLARFTGANTISSRMNSRQGRLGADKTGGMFDIIYRKKKERERATQEAYDAN